MRRRVFWFASLLGASNGAFAQPASEMQRCLVELQNVVAQKLNQRYLELRRPEEAARNYLVSLFSVPHASLAVLREIAIADDGELQTITSELKKLPETQRRRLISDAGAWAKWAEENPKFHKIRRIPHEGHFYSKMFLEQTLPLQKRLAEQGVVTRLLPAKRIPNSYWDEGVLAIESFNPPQNLKTKISPNDSIFKSGDFGVFLKAAAADGGLIAIDPVLDPSASKKFSVMGYFINLSPDATKRWSVMLPSNAKWNLLVHEWEHSIDFATDVKNYKKSLIGSREGLPEPKTALGKLLRKKGGALERDYLSELNATGREFKLYFETKKFPADEFMSTVVYRIENEVKVAVGRIMVDPNDPRHYWLLLRSVGGPISLVSIVAGSVQGLEQAVTKAMHRESLNSP